MILVAMFVLATGLTTISMFSIFGLHAHEIKFYVPPNKDIYECQLQRLNENHLEQFELGKDRIITCLYRCEDSHGAFKWIERTNQNGGCKFNTRVYKTQAMVWKWFK